VNRHRWTYQGEIWQERTVDFTIIIIFFYLPSVVIINNNNNNNNIVICKAHKVSSNAESEAPAVARWAALVGYAKRTVLRRRLKVSAVYSKSFQTVGAR